MKLGAKATREAVFAACQSLAMSGTSPPTVRDVLRATGGSLSTITPLREEWWKSIQKRLREGETVKGLPAEVSELFANLWNTVSEHALRALDSDREELRRATEDANRAAASAQSQVEAAQRQTEAAEASRDAAAAAKTQAETRLAESAAEHRGVVATLTSQIAARTAELHASTEARAADASRWDEERRRLLVQVDSHRQEAVRAQNELTQLQPQIGEAKTRAAADAARIEQLERDLAVAKEETQRARAAEVSATSAATAAASQCDALAAEVRVKDALLKSQGEALLANADATKSFATELEGFKRQLSPPPLPASAKRRANRRPNARSETKP